MSRTDELHTARIESLVAPTKLVLRYLATPGVTTHATDSRRRIEEIPNGEDKRLLVIIGPYSIHDLTTAMEYATRLRSLRNQCQSRLEIIMRIYFEKPRTVVDQKGLTSDLDLNGSYWVNHDLKLACKLLLQVNELGVPTATELLDMVTGQFIADLINWGMIDVRTTESQIHHEMASAFSCLVGFRNGTDGNTRIAVDAIRTVRVSHMFLSPDKNDQIAIYRTSDSPYGRIIMRGGRKPNYHADDIAAVCDTLYEFDLPEYLVADFSHDNCQKQHRRQSEVCEDICQQIHNGSTAITGIMTESLLHERTQKIIGGQPPTYGQSIIDPCSDWEDTERLVEKLAFVIDTRSWMCAHSWWDGYFCATCCLLNKLLLALARHNIDNRNHHYINYYQLLCIIWIVENSRLKRMPVTRPLPRSPSSELPARHCQVRMAN